MAGRGAAGGGQQGDARGGGRVRGCHDGHLVQQGRAGGHPRQGGCGRPPVRLQSTLHVHRLPARCAGHGQVAPALGPQLCACLRRVLLLTPSPWPAGLLLAMRLLVGGRARTSSPPTIHASAAAVCRGRSAGCACAGPRSELGEAAAAADDERSFFDVAESDLASSEGAPSVPVRMCWCPRVQMHLSLRTQVVLLLGPQTAKLIATRRMLQFDQGRREHGFGGRCKRLALLVH